MNKSYLRCTILYLFLFVFVFNANAQQRSVEGTVTDEDGQTLPGVTVSLEGTGMVQKTDSEGRFTVSVPREGGTLIFSSVGYALREVPITTESTVNVTLQRELTDLDEVVVVGYGTQKKINLTGSVATISGRELTETPTNNLTNAVGGRLPGIIATQGNGRPGFGSTLQIRGLSTLNNNTPLVVVDGVVRTDGFGNLDPAEVESISILKDASSAAVYGARAANGVILVTTKRGGSGKPTLSYSGMVGTQQPTQYPDLMSSYEYATVRNQALLNQGYDPDNPSQTGLFYSDSELERFKPGITDWYDETFKKNSLLMQHNLSVNGGTDALRYFLSLGYLRQDGMYDNTDFKRYNLRSNVDAKINDNLSIGLNLEGRQEVSTYPGWDANSIFQLVINQNPLLPAYYPSGRPYNTNAEHPVEMIKSSGYNKNPFNIYQGTLTFDQQLPFITEGLSLRGSGAYFRQNRFNKIFITPYTMYSEDDQGNVIGEKVVGQQTYLSEMYHELTDISLNLSLNYARTFNRHDISGLLLAEQYSSKGNTFTARKQDFSTNIKDEFFASGPANQTINGNGILNDLRRSVVGRLNYAYNSKYLLEGTFRYDGSYRFPENKRFGFFPAFSAGWRISEETFFADIKEKGYINELKLRVSKGLIGNDRVAAFQFMDAYAITTNRGPVMDNQAEAFVTYGVFPNPNITWEKQDNTNIGLDASFIGSKVNLEFDYFFRVTRDILWSRDRSVPGTFGRNLPNENYAKMKSRGFEFSLLHQNSFHDFNYNVRLIGSYTTNLVTSIDDPSNALDYQRQLNRPLGYRYGYKSLGLFQSQEEADNWYGGSQFGQKSLAGDIKYADVDGNGSITLQDQEVLTNDGNTPRVVYGLSGGFNWKGLDFSFLLQGSALRTVFLAGTGGRIMYNGGFRNNFQYLSDSWSPDNRDAKYPLPWVGSRTINDRDSDFWLRKAAYFRLKSVNLGYTFSSSHFRRFGMEKLRMYVSGFNLLTWSQLKEFDPEAEVATGAYYPQQRNFNIGINVSF